MAPEGPGSVTILDLTFEGRKLVARVDRIAPPGPHLDALFVSWSSEEAIEGYIPAGDGVVQVRTPEGYERRRYRAPVPKGGDRFIWKDVVHGMGLMLVVVLPRGRVLQSLADAEPTPVAFKEFNGRMALYWKLRSEGSNEANVWWRMEEAEPSAVQAVCEQLTEEKLDDRGGHVDVGSRIDPPKPEEAPGTASQPKELDGAPEDAPHEALSPSSPAHRLLVTITYGTFAVGVLLAVLGVVLVLLGGEGSTGFELFGQSLETRNAGIAALGVGALLIIVNIGRVVQAAVRIAGER